MVLSRPEFTRDQMCGAGAHSAADVCNDKGRGRPPLPRIMTWTWGSTPIQFEFGAEIALGLRHQVPGKALGSESCSASAGETINRK